MRPTACQVNLVSPYDLGRQPFALAEPAALLARDGFSVTCLDLSLQKLESIAWRDAAFVAIYLGMHTATRIALEALPRIRTLAPRARICAYGLYAPMNAELLRARGVTDVIGGEFEPALVAAARDARDGGRGDAAAAPVVHRGKVEFIVPERVGLPGFIEARRYRSHDDASSPQPPRYFTCYWLASIDALVTPP